MTISELAAETGPAQPVSPSHQVAAPTFALLGAASSQSALATT